MSCCLGMAEAEEAEEVEGEAGTLGVTVHEYLVTSDFFAFSLL